MNLHSTTPGGGKILVFEVPIRALGVPARRVWVYLPPGYDSSGLRYPTLYMQDGQNLFDPATSYCGDWGVQRLLDGLVAEGKTAGAVVVGVDHAGAERWCEYSPWHNAPMGRPGCGKVYAQFLARELKPFIDANFRTLSGREGAGVAGSSYGGIISLYCLLAHPDVFSRAALFSPSFWSAGAGAEDLLAAARLPPDTRVYLDVGRDEGDHGAEYVRDARHFSVLLRKKGLKQKFLLDEAGAHNEASWSARFPGAFLWLFEGGSRKK